MKDKDAKKLGKGLGALLGGGDLPIAPNSVARIKQDSVGTIRIESIEVNPNQPRTKFDEEALKELAESIKTYGLIQPITVRPISNGKYQLISGERRLRACKLAGLQEIPTYVRTVDDMQSIQMALVENIQREDLNALEIALSYQRLMDELGFTQDEVSDKVGKNRSTITNYVRLLKLQLSCQEHNYQIERDMSTVYYMDNVDDVDNLDERKSDKKDFSSPLKWVGFKQQFFTSTLIAQSGEFSTAALEVTTPAKNETQLLKTMEAQLDFSVSDLNSGSFDMMMYMGPSQYKLLKEYDLKLERQVPLGWGFFLLQWCNRYIIIPVFNWLESYGISYGIIILILSLFIKLLVTPVNYKTYLSSAKMRALKPEVDALSKRYPKADQNQDEMMKKQQATMALYKSAKASPMAGCLPALIQMPILIAMYRFFPSAYELRQKSFLWADDLSSYDSILDLSFNIPLYGNHVSLFTLLMTISTIAYTYMNNKLMSPATGNNDQQKMMKWMMYIMPIMFLFMFNSFASALTYYYLLINLITFAQNGIFMLTVKQDKLRAQLLENMKQPVKKSKWQLRMEEMMKQQQQLAKQQGRK